MNLFLSALLTGFLIESQGQQTIRNCHNNNMSINARNQNKQLFICKKTIEIASENPFYTENKTSDLFMLYKGHKPLNETEMLSNEYSYEAVNVFQDSNCNSNSAITITDKAIMNTLYKQITFIKQQQDK